MNIFKLFPIFFLVVFLFPTYAQWILHIIDSQLPHATIIDTGDIDNDGDLDILEGKDGQEYSTSYLNDGTGHFVEAPLPQAIGTSSFLTLLDTDNDGDLDLLETNATRPIQIYLNQTN